MFRLIAFIGLVGLCTNSGYSADPVGRIGARDAARLKQLRGQLFEKSHPAETVSQLLPRLRDADKRETVIKSIVEVARQHQKLICEFANKSSDIEVHEACAEIVQALDDDWKMTEAGREYESISRANINALLPQAWKDFERDSTDLAASATILSADPEVVWKWLGPPAKPARNARRTKDPHAIYLSLRMRERSPDEFVRRTNGW